jgi:hypothetical protein
MPFISRMAALYESQTKEDLEANKKEKNKLGQISRFPFHYLL